MRRMSAPRTRPGSKPARPPRAGRRPDRGRTRPALRPASLALLAIGVAAIALVVARDRPGAPRESADPVASMDGAEAFRTGTRLGSQGEYGRSLPYLRRALAANPGLWEARFNLASSLANTALQVRRHLGHDEPATRSSADRLALLREAERELESAIATARSPHEAALAAWTKANLYRSWGLPADALECAKRALALEPGSPSAARLLATIEADFARAERAP